MHTGCNHKSTHVDQPHSSAALLFGQRQTTWYLLLKDVALANEVFAKWWS